MTRTRAASRRRGISLLLEVMLGIGIFSTCLLLLFGLFPTANQSLAMARDVSQATNFARDKAEQLRVAGFFDPNNSAGPHGPAIISGRAVINGTPVQTDYSVSWNVVATTATLKTITVHVKWTVGAAGVGGFNREVEVETFVTSS